MELARHEIVGIAICLAMAMLLIFISIKRGDDFEQRMIDETIAQHTMHVF